MAFRAAPNTAMRKKPDTYQGIVKQSVTRIPTWFVINAFAGFLATTIVVLALRGVFYKEPILVCSERLGNGTLFGLQDRAGAAISASDLQSRLGGRDWGVLENSKVVALKEGPAQVAMQVALPRRPAASGTGVKQHSGMGFTWLMPSLAAATSACLSYDVWLPEDFEFGQGGALPGLFGGTTTEVPGKGATGFAARNGWGENGTAVVRAVTATEPRGMVVKIDPDSLHLDRGRWLHIEQEVILNDVGEDNGVLRLWVDGKIYLNEQGITYRADESGRFRGVIADVHYGDSGTDFSAVPKSSTLQFTPFVLRWQ
jgi:hypothetical protein